MPSSDDSMGLETLQADMAWLQRFARRLGGNDEELADLTQDAWTAALEKAPPELSRQGLRGWLARVVRQRIYRSWRDRSLRRHHEAAGASEMLGGDTPGEVHQQEMQRRLTRMLYALEEPYRGALLLRYFEQLSYDELGQRLNIAPAAARKRVSRGTAKVRERLRRDLGESEWRDALAGFLLEAAPSADTPRAWPWVAALALGLALGWFALKPSASVSPAWKLAGWSASAASAQASSADEGERAALASLSRYMGNWVLPAGQDGENISFSWSDEHKCVSIQQYDALTGELRGDGLIGWNPLLGQLAMTEFLREREDSESMFEGGVWFDGDVMWREYVSLEPDGSSNAWREQWTPGLASDEQTLHIDYMAPTGDWVPIYRFPMQRTPSKLGANQ